MEDKPDLAARSFPIQKAVKDIEEICYQEVKGARDICLLGVILEERFQLVIDNYAEWERELLDQALTHQLWGTSKHDSMQQRLTLDRRLTNVLTGFRLYVDQTDSNISEVFGGSGDELKNIRRFRHELYDNNFGYRFLEALRNHVRHYGLPIEIIMFHSGAADEQLTSIRFSVTPYAIFDALAANKDFKKSVLNELKSVGGKIDLRLPVREYVACLVKIHHEVRRIFSTVIRDSREVFSKAVEEYSVFNGQVLKHPKLERIEGVGKVNEQVDLIKTFLNSYDVLYRQNSQVRRVSESFVSNAIKKG